MKMTSWVRRSAAVLVAVVTLVTGLSAGGVAAAAGSEGPASQLAVGAGARYTGGIKDFGVVADEGGLVITASPYCNALWNRCDAWVQYPGQSKRIIDPRNGWRTSWPSGWAPSTRGTVEIGFYLVDVFNVPYSGYPPLTMSVVRPEPFVGLTASVIRIDHVGKTATVFGNATKGAEIRLRGAGVSGSTGQWQATVSGLQVGSNTLTFEQWVGGVHRDSRTVTVVIDPPAPSLTARGSFSTDPALPGRITGVATKGATVVFRSGGVSLGETPASTADGSYVWDVPAPNAGGTRTYAVSQRVSGDETGNVPVTLDFGRAVSITSPEDGGAAEPGRQTIVGAGEDGASVTVSLDGADLPATSVSGGAWRVDAELPRGETKVVATQKSRGANTTTASATVNPGEGAVELTAHGRFDSADATRPATAYGSAPTGSTVILRNSVGTEIGRTVAAGDRYEIRIDPSKATSGTNSFSVVLAGSESDAKSFTLDYGKPAAPLVVTEPAKDGTVEPGTISFAGTGQAGSRVEVRGSSREVASAAVTSEGTWSADSTVELTEGSYDLHFDQISKGGLENTIRHAFTVGETATIVTPHTITSPAVGEVLDTLTPTFRGTGHEGATITVRGATRVVATGVVTNGQWVAQTNQNAPLAPGRYDLHVDQSVRGTVVGTIRAQFEVSAEAFRQLTLSAPAPNENVTVLRPTFVGTATPGAAIRVGSSRTTVATATVAADGTWRATAAIDLERGGAYDLEVKQTTKTNKTSTVSAPFTIDRNAQ